jgi:Family of unknown function (DUF5670)
MLYTLALMLTTLWLLGLVNGYLFAGFIHMLPVAAVVLVLLNYHLGGKQV